MRKFVLGALCAAMLMPIEAPAQTVTPPSKPPVTLPTPEARPAAAEAPQRRTRGRDLNLQVELTFTDQLGSGAPAKKVVSMMAADGTLGRIRSVVGPMLSFLNVDARPQVLDSGGILLELTVEYKPEQAEGGPTNVMRTAVNESLSIILQNGKPLVVSQAADPVADRKMTVEVKVTIIK